MSETAAIPPGYQPLFLATASCEIFNLRPGVDVNAETPMKMIPKTDILADIDTRRAVSDFQPFKSVISVNILLLQLAIAYTIQAYPNESLLVFFDAEWKYGQNFYIITSAEAAESILHVCHTIIHS